jgi:hypothetical protein
LPFDGKSKVVSTNPRRFFLKIESFVVFFSFKTVSSMFISSFFSLLSILIFFFLQFNSEV